MSVTVVIMNTSGHLAARKIDRFEKNIAEREAVPETTMKREGSILLVLLSLDSSSLLSLDHVFFVVCNSSVPDNQDSDRRRQGMNCH
ncbi:hypothetical protein SADUNF_Sadunf01G0043800 [Salix dunnii]|uniref:Uncharacterized protein n=1 Tax=Salix dunnii TaxID=1413687 RepID=A0A835NA89_9ROSI|nr:hypothetical protein SADUNF_Sadunf01G0043800 [Salix dunnii]